MLQHHWWAILLVVLLASLLADCGTARPFCNFVLVGTVTADSYIHIVCDTPQGNGQQ